MSSKVSISEWDNNNKSLEFLQVRYTDVLGRFLARYLSMPADIEGFFKHGIGLDGSSVRGFAYIDDSDLLLLPDGSTAKTVPLFFYSRILLLKGMKSRKEIEKDDLGRLGGITMFDLNSIYIVVEEEND